jgi:hypothetical protein
MTSKNGINSLNIRRAAIRNGCILKENHVSSKADFLQENDTYYNEV